MFKVWELGYTARSNLKTMPKPRLLLLTLSVIVLTASLTLIFNSGGEKSSPKEEIDTAVNQAKFLYHQRQESSEDFSNGPCLSNALMPGWVVDIAHQPRLPIDDLPENQCAAYREGRAAHFVELDTEGNLIRAR